MGVVSSAGARSRETLWLLGKVDLSLRPNAMKSLTRIIGNHFHANLFLEESLGTPFFQRYLKALDVWMQDSSTDMHFVIGQSIGAALQMKMGTDPATRQANRQSAKGFLKKWLGKKIDLQVLLLYVKQVDFSWNLNRELADEVWNYLMPRLQELKEPLDQENLHGLIRWMDHLKDKKSLVSILAKNLKVMGGGPAFAKKLVDELEKKPSESQKNFMLGALLFEDILKQLPETYTKGDGKGDIRTLRIAALSLIF